MAAEIRLFPCLSDNFGYLIRDPATKATASIDAPEAAPVIAALEREGWTLTDILNDHFDLGLTDAFCGFKAHRVSATQRLNLTEEGYAFPMQLWPRAAMAGLRIREIPVRLIYKDKTRHFGGTLDDPDNRLCHYLQVLRAEVEQPVCTASPCPCAC